MHPLHGGWERKFFSEGKNQRQDGSKVFPRPATSWRAEEIEDSPFATGPRLGSISANAKTRFSELNPSQETLSAADHARMYSTEPAVDFDPLLQYEESHDQWHRLQEQYGAVADRPLRDRPVMPGSSVGSHVGVRWSDRKGLPPLTLAERRDLETGQELKRMRRSEHVEATRRDVHRIINRLQQNKDSARRWLLDYNDLLSWETNAQWLQKEAEYLKSDLQFESDERLTDGEGRLVVARELRRLLEPEITEEPLVNQAVKRFSWSTWRDLVTEEDIANAKNKDRYNRPWWYDQLESERIAAEIKQQRVQNAARITRRPEERSWF